MSAPQSDELNGFFRRVTEQFGDTIIAKVDLRGVVRYLNPFGLRLIGQDDAILPLGLH